MNIVDFVVTEICVALYVINDMLIVNVKQLIV